jgi:endonuclease/exonuclease/phosphatase family metal-dependent hydrolase
MTMLRVATYNVHGCRGPDPRSAPDPERIAAVIAELEADVIGLQEVGSRREVIEGTTQLELLAERSGLEAIDGAVWTKGRSAYGNAILTRHRASQVLRLDLSVKGREPRGMLDVRLSIGRLDLRVVVTHFGLRATERKRQVDSLIENLGERCDEPLIVVGDFNEWHPRGDSLARLHHTFGHAPRVRSFPARFPIFALDRIWVRPHRALVDVRAVTTPTARRASDHLPVVATIDVGLLANGSSG